MEENQKQQPPPDQLNPGETDQFGNEVVIKKNEGISDQGNEWSDKEEIKNKEDLFDPKGEKYLKESADIEDLPEEEDEKQADNYLKNKSAADVNVADDDDGENEDDVIENKADYVPGYDLGRNKVQ